MPREWLALMILDITLRVRSNTILTYWSWHLNISSRWIIGSNIAIWNHFVQLHHIKSVRMIKNCSYTTTDGSLKIVENITLICMESRPL